MKTIPILILFFSFSASHIYAQTPDPVSDNIMTLNEYLGFVKKYHPVVKQAKLEVSKAQAALMAARGGFDPKIAIDYNTKQFSGSEYYDILNANFKIPTWFGIEIKAGYELADGVFLNPEKTVPENGLYNAGISVPVGQGLFIDERMAALKQAKVFVNLSEVTRDLQINQILFDALIAYFDWYIAYSKRELYQNFLKNATVRFKGIKEQVIRGDKAVIDSVEAGITIKIRTLNLEQAHIDYVKKAMKLSNFLWIDTNIPLELQPDVVPDSSLAEHLEETLKINMMSALNVALENHPKIKTIQYKIETLQIARRLKAEMLKPQIDLYYNFITSNAKTINTINTGDYKWGASFSLPLFLRKERGHLKLADYKIQDTQLSYELELLRLKNKIDTHLQELQSYTDQLSLIKTIINDYQKLRHAEERKFSLGESSVFLINSREQHLINGKIKQLELYYKFFTTKAQLFRTLALPIDDPT